MRKILFSIIVVFFACSSVVFISSFIENRDWTLFVPSTVFTIITLILTYILTIELVLGYKVFRCDNSVLYINRKDKIKKKIHKDEISNIVLILDCFKEELHIVSFTYNNKKIYVPINRENKDSILDFIQGIDYTESRNWWYYLILFFTF